MVGSLRKDSYHRKIFEIYKKIADGIFTFHEIPTTDFPLYNADLEESKPKAIEEHAQAIRDSKGVLFISPEYNYSIPGHLKNAIDWLSRVSPQPFNGMKGAIVGGSPGAVGTARMQYELRKVAVFLNLQFMNKPEVMISKMYEKFDDQQTLTDKQTEEFLQKHISAFAEYLK